ARSRNYYFDYWG
nr:immunoglobulin heavy chain junction region [Mus musculus]